MDLLNQNITFSVGTVLSVIAILVLGNIFLTLLINYFVYEKKIWKEKLLLLDEERKNFNDTVEQKVKEQVQKFQLETKINRLSSVFDAIESLRRITPDYSHQTKYYKEVNPNLLDLEKKEFDNMVEHIIGLIKYHRNLADEKYIQENV